MAYQPTCTKTKTRADGVVLHCFRTEGHGGVGPDHSWYDPRLGINATIHDHPLQHMNDESINDIAQHLYESCGMPSGAVTVEQWHQLDEYDQNNWRADAKDLIEFIIKINS